MSAPLAEVVLVEPRYAVQAAEHTIGEPAGADAVSFLWSAAELPPALRTAILTGGGGDAFLLRHRPTSLRADPARNRRERLVTTAAGCIAVAVHVREEGVDELARVQAVPEDDCR